MLYYGLHWSEKLRVAPTILLTNEQERDLTRLARSKRTSVRLAQRAQIVLLAAQGLQNRDIAEQLGIGRVQVARWRERYLKCGLQGIERDLPRGAPPVKVDVAKLVEMTTQTTPEAATHWSTRKMGAALGVSASTVMRHWQAHGLKPHIVRGFKVSRDPSSSRSSKTSWICTCHPPSMRWCCAATRRVRYRRWTARSQVCP
jgi:transposase